ncbi:MAG: autotransporter domain-containing protein, partial [Akkermansia sp.]|nr:autotransporter domain-containing protein [Akkermansia sp.]
YALASGVSGLGLVLDDSWSGTVSFTAAQLNTLDGSWKSGSTVSLTGATGILGAADNEATIVLNKGESDWGFGQTGDGMYSATLNGTITGDGNLGVKSGTATSIFELNGNTAAWTGNFIVATAADVTLSLGGDAKTINGSVSGSNLTLKLKTDATLKSDSTVAWVNATAGSLKVDAGKTLTVTDTILPDNIKLGAGASIAAAFMGGTEYGYMDGTIANETGSDQDVTINNADITVTGATLCTGGGTGFTVDNKLADAKLLVAETLTKAVVLNNVQDSLEVVDDLAIGATGSLKVANGGAKQELVIGGGTTLTLADGITLDANVAIGSGATLTLNYNTAGTPVATTLNNGSLSLANGLTLSGNVYSQMAAFTDADDNTVVDLFQGVGALTLGGSAYTGEVNAMQYFTNLTGLSDLGDFTLLYNDSTDTVSIRFNLSEARTLTWNGTEGNSAWEVGDGTAENWLDAAQQDTCFDTGDNARFTGDAAKKQVTIADGRTEARDITISGADAQYAFAVSGDSTLAASNLMKVSDGASLAKTGAGNLTLELSGALDLENGSLAVQQGGLAVATINADADSTITLDGTLRVAQGSINGITAHEGSTLVIGTVGAIDAGTLAIATDTSLYGLVNQGTLNVGTNELTLKQAVAQGGNVVAGTLSLEESGSAFGNVTANSIHFAYGTLDVADPNVTVDTIAANGPFPVVTLDLTEALADGGSLSPLQRLEWATTYTLVHANGGLEGVNFTLGETLGLLVQNGLIHEGAGLVKTDNDVKLTVGGQDLTWYTSKNSTEWGYNVVTGGNIAHGANTLNGVQHVVVDQSLVLDVTGVGAAPGLRMRNLSGVEDETLILIGDRSDAVTLVTTEATESAVGVQAHGISLHVGLDEYDELDNTDYADLKVGVLDLEDAALIVNGDASFTVDTLYGDDDSLLAGKVVVEGQGGSYSGGYAGAEVVLHEDAVQTLAAGEGLTVEGDGMALLTYAEGVTHMDGIAGIGLTVLLNDPNEDNSASTLVLDNASGLLFGSIHAGISAINSALTLDTDEAPDLLEADSLDLDGTTVVLHQAASDGTALAMATTEGAHKTGTYLAHLGADDSTADVQLDGYLLEKYYENARLEGGNVLVDRRTDFYSDLTQAEVHAPNAQAGAGLLDDALLHSNPQVTNPEGDLSNLMTALELGYVPQRQVENVMAAVSGASHAALGAAWSHDVDRQLRAIRNRTAQMGLSGDAANQGLPYFNAWINAEGDYHKLNADGLMPGYKMSSWGATLGFDVDCTPRFTFGAAFSALSGDFTAYSEDMAKGDLDRMYLSVFGRYTYRAWTHTLLFTYGSADTKIDRTVDFAAGCYSGTTESDGSAWGLMYELGYVAALNEDASTCLQPIVNVSYRQSTLNGAKETGVSDAALEFGDAEAKLFTAAVGARLQSVIGTNIYNRASLFEGRVLFKFDSGDRAVEARNSLVGVPGVRSVKSAEVGVFGVEVGAGITIPMAENAGALFLDVTGDFRSKYTEINGTVGYRFNF